MSRLPDRAWCFTGWTATAVVTGFAMLPVAGFLAFRGSVLAVLVFGVCGVGVRLLLNRAWDTTTNERRLTPVTDDFDGVAVAVRTLSIWPASYYALVIALWVVAVAVLAQT